MALTLEGARIVSPPSNYILVRSATLDFYKADQIGPTQFVDTEIMKTDPGLDLIITTEGRP